ncbi:hypothetical protein ACOMHN_042702 [Nucella lapillus]
MQPGPGRRGRSRRGTSSASWTLRASPFTRRKGGHVLKTYRCARGSTSLESFHLHLNRFIPGRKERQPSATTLPATSSLYPVLPRRPQSNEPVLSRVREGHYERKQGRQAEDPATVQQKARLAVLRKGGNPGDRTQLLGQHVLQFGKFQVFCAVCRPRLRRSITKQELALHCRRATRGTEETTLLLNSLIDLYTQPHATDTLDAARAWQTWEEQKRHVKCILDPEGVSLYQEERRACLKDVQVRTRLHIPGVFPPASEPLHPR